MGACPSPYNACQMIAWALEFAVGRPMEETSAFWWVQVRLNLPGMVEYDPALPCVMKIDPDGEIATEVVVFFDDGWCIAPNAKEVPCRSPPGNFVIAIFGDSRCQPEAKASFYASRCLGWRCMLYRPWDPLLVYLTKTLGQTSRAFRMVGRSGAGRISYPINIFSASMGIWSMFQ